ncbi:hypothetical protein [Pseudosporangium ferrugineum]|uniref:Uncharacterized protein n=1 Tax=Pseudosporangium ferrugineum TaxID=439699 RepID=A0A2T0RDL2_9ACTN|nr:hypothetical protein [Pseudosporangium ferrugineum]PRY19255.1 hypothetical protein CLV70_13618 [Pseudosporangium ferrugineum]
MHRWHSLRSPLPMIGVATAVAIGTGVAAYANWDVKAEAATFTVRAASIPRMAAPDSRLPSGEPDVGTDGLVRHGPRITWRRIRIAEGVPVQRYVVVRHLGPITQVACDVPARRSSCVDAHPPAGYLVTYTVAARYGSHWSGMPSEPGPPVLMPGEAAPIMVDGVVVLPGADGGGLVPVPGGGPSVAPSAETAAESGTGTGAVTDTGLPVDAPPSQAPIIVPPAPPEAEEPVAESSPVPTGPASGAPPRIPVAGNGENEENTPLTGVD